MNKKIFVIYFKLIFLLFLTTSCGGGGGGGGINSSGGSSFNTAEFQSNFGLSRIGALTALNNNGTGSGIIVGVLDTGIDIDNIEFSGRISNNSSNITEGAAVNVDDKEGHGTAVAGIIGAAKNDSGIHGVAPSSILLVKKLNIGAALTLLNVDVGINSAVSNGAKVINMSFGTDAPALPSASEQAAMQNAVDQGVILVVATGNSSLSQVLNFARLADCTGGGGICNGFNARGRMIAVNAVDSNNNETAFGNRCGDTSTACMVAPGQNINSTSIGGGTSVVTGTSFSAPHVTGAVAVLLQKFPTITPSDAVNLLLSTATDLGSTGIDNVFGNGLLNLQNAFSARGLASLPTGQFIGGNNIALVKTSFNLDPVFGNALENNSLLARAIILDQYNRPYRVDLNNRINSSNYKSALENLIVTKENNNYEIDAIPSTKLNIFSEKDKINSKGLLDNNNIENNQIQLETLLFNNTYIKIGSNLDSNIFFSNFNRKYSDVFYEETFMPQLKFINNGNGSGIKFKLQPNLNFTLSKFEDSNNYNLTKRVLDQYNIIHKKNNLNLNLGFGILNETKSILNSFSSGAFGFISDTESKFFSVSSNYKVNSNLKIFANYSKNISEIPNSDGYISNWSKIKSNSFRIGFKKINSITKNDSLKLSVFQPLRVYSASADLNIPIDTEKKPFGRIIYKKERHSIVPKHRQISLEGIYSWGNEFIQFSNFSIVDFNPGHIYSNKPNLIYGLKTKINF